MVSVPERFSEYLLCDRQHRHVLYVWVVLYSVAYNMMGVVVALPPAYGQPHQGTEDGTNQVVLMKIVRDPRMPKVVA